jgi:hypothetical protein
MIDVPLRIKLYLKKKSLVILLLAILLVGLSASFASSLNKLYGLTHPDFDRYYELTVVPTYSGFISLYTTAFQFTPASGNYSIPGNETASHTVRLLASPYLGYVFDYWKINGDDVYASNAYALALQNDTTVEAIFSSRTPFNSTVPLYQNLIALTNAINFNGKADDSPYPQFAFMVEHLAGAQLGIYSPQELADFASSLLNQNSSDSAKAQEILYAYTVLMPYGIANQTVIEWALDNQPMLNNGLPDTGASFGLTSAFWLHDRYTLNGYYWAQFYNHAVSKWNLTLAYHSFLSALETRTDGCPAALYVTSSGGTYCQWGDGRPRYYDECAETIDVYLRFYQLGVADALPNAVAVWSYLNDNTWYTDHYGYFVGQESFECEAGGFYQIALKLKYYVPSLPYTERLAIDATTRFMQNGFNSKQWTTNQGGFVVHDSGMDATSARLENTLISWAVLYGLFSSFDASQQALFQNMLNGVGTDGGLKAWQYTFSVDGDKDSQLYNSYLAQFQWQTTSPPTWGPVATSAAESLLILLGVTPVTTTLAVPLSENIYEDLTCLVNPRVISLNLNTSVLQVAVASEGMLNFNYGAESVNCTFPSSGVYSIQFSSDWNQIRDVKRVGEVPDECLYFESVLSAQSSSQPAWALQNMIVNATIDSSGVTGNVTHSVIPEASGVNKTSLPSASAKLTSSQPTTKPYVSLVGVSPVWLIATILYSQIFVGAGVIILMVFRQARAQKRSIHSPSI